MANIWIDGLCKGCGGLVVEKGSQEKDYQNICTNPSCPEHIWQFGIMYLTTNY